jgi:hypothetical protein
VTVRPLASLPRAGQAFLGAVLIATLAVVASRASTVPTWDGRIYADCIIDAALRHLASSTMRCGGHPSHAFTLYMGLFQMLSPESFLPMLVASVVLYLLSCAAVYRLAEIAFFGPEHSTERALITAVVAAQPALLASVVQPNVDLPLLPAFLWGTVFIIRRRWLPLIAVGCALVFTKETGVLLYVILVAAYAIAMTLPRPSSPRSPTRTVLRLAPLAIPVVLFVAYVAYRKSVTNQAALWNAGSRKVLVFQFLFPRIDQYFVNYLAMMLVLSFAWITTTVLVADGAVGVVRAIRSRPRRALPGSKRRVVRFLVVLGLATMYALTRFSSWGNARYLLPVFALTPLMLYAALVRFGTSPKVRRSVLALLAMLLLISVVRSVDPLSRATYGTFTVGDRDLLRMTGVSGECCGAGRDQLVYNLQFTALGDLASEATAALMNDSTVVFLPALTRWFFIGPLDSATHRRTLSRERTITPLVFEPDTLKLLATPPANAIFIALPNGDPAAAMRTLRGWYEIGARRRLRRGGYWMDAYPLTLRDGRGS